MKIVQTNLCLLSGQPKLHLRYSLAITTCGQLHQSSLMSQLRCWAGPLRALSGSWTKPSDRTPLHIYNVTGIRLPLIWLGPGQCTPLSSPVGCSDDGYKFHQIQYALFQFKATTISLPRQCKIPDHHRHDNTTRKPE